MAYAVDQIGTQEYMLVWQRDVVLRGLIVNCGLRQYEIPFAFLHRYITSTDDAHVRFLVVERHGDHVIWRAPSHKDVPGARVSRRAKPHRKSRRRGDQAEEPEQKQTCDAETQ